MHITTSKTKRMLFAPLLKTVECLTPRYPVFMAKVRYFARFKKRINLKDPKDLNEKILWLAIYSDTREWSRLSDKYAVREYVREKGLDDILVPLFQVCETPDHFQFDKLPETFIIKSTNGSGGNYIVKSKSSCGQDFLKKKVNELLGCNYMTMITGVGDLHYLRINNKLIFEGLLINDPISAHYSATLIDYKVWCFNGKAEYIWVCMNRFVHNKDGAEVLIYDRDWNTHPEYSVWSKDFTQAAPIPKPKNFERMLEVAEILCRGFPVVRCDLYNLNGKIYFGEMTFTSLGGMMDFYTPEFLDLCGDKIDISNVPINKFEI